MTTRQSKRDRQLVQESPVTIPLQDRYTALDAVEGNDLSGESSSSQTRCTTVGSAVEGRGKKCASARVIGDSIVRGRDRCFWPQMRLQDGMLHPWC